MNDLNEIRINDVAHSVTKGVIGTIPLIGTLASETFNLVVTPPLEKRRAQWMNEIALRLSELEDKQIIEIGSLKDNEQFIDVLLQATTYAIKTSEKEKIKAFQNAIVNSAVGEVPGKTITQIFLNFLDNYTIWHIKILNFIDNPRQWFINANQTPPNYMTASISDIIEVAFPELKGQDYLLEIIWRDLKSSGFHNTTDVKAMMSGDGTLSNRTTKFGKEFLKFITDANS